MALFEDQNITIFSSREEIRNNLIIFAKQYLELETVDLYKTSFVSYIINVLSILSANQMFYESSMYKEFFLTKAQLMESVVNLANWIGYTVPDATPASVNVLFDMPLSFKDAQISFTIPNDFTVTASDMVFMIDSTFALEAVLESSTEDSVQEEIQSMITQGIQVEILNNRLVTVRNANGFSFPVQLDIREGADNSAVQFSLPFNQISKQLEVFQIPETLEYYQFFSKRISELTGQISDSEVYVFPKEIDITEIDTIGDFDIAFDEETKNQYKWTESEAGLYTLTQDDEEYVINKYGTEADFSFGNGVLGKQPPRDGSIIIILTLTKGEDGNIIPGAITTADDLYYQSSENRVQKIKFDVTNVASGTGGKNAPTISEIKSAAITNLTSKQRLVSSLDYKNFDDIATDVPLYNATPILKRSDLKINEICMFSMLTYTNPAGTEEIVPTRNIIFPVDSTADISSSNLYIPRGTSPGGINSDYETLFNMYVIPATSSVEYEYSTNEIDITTALQNTDPQYNPLAYLIVPSVTFSTEINSTNTDLIDVDVYANVEHVITDYVTQFRAKLTTMYNGLVYNMATELDTDDPSIIVGFSYSFTDILNFPKGNVQFKVSVEGLIPYDKITQEDKIRLGIADDPTQPSVWFTISIYTSDVTLRQDLSSYMISSVTTETTDGIITYSIHNVPVILTEYLNQEGFNQKDFEFAVLQDLIDNIKINSKKMLTDFINIKFPDTTGSLTNMQLNETETIPVISRSLTSIPSSPSLNDCYIINGQEGTDSFSQNWNDYINDLVTWNGATWVIETPNLDTTIIVENSYDPLDPDEGKTLVWNGAEWVYSVFNIPLELEVQIHKDPVYSLSSSALVSNIKTAVLTYFASKFGMDKDLDRSELLSVIRQVEGVRYATIIRPEIDIKFTYELEDLTFAQLLDYTPQLVAITSDSITIIIV